MTRKYLDNLDSDGGDVVPEGVYEVECVDARALEDKAFLWLDLKILTGPDADRVVSVSLNIPGEDAARGATFWFKKKVRGFAAVVQAANAASGDDDLEFAAQIAEHLVGSRFEAGLSVQKEGAYEGSQQVDYTKPLAADAPPAPPVTPAVAETVAPAAPAPVAEEEEDDSDPF